MIWFGGLSIIVGYLMSKMDYTHILNTYDLVWWHTNHCRLFNAKNGLYTY